MRHLDDGTLRRLYDQPEALAAADRAHLAACARCQDAHALVTADAHAAAGLLAPLALPAARVDHVAALREIRQRVAADPAGATHVRLPRPRGPWRPFERITPMYQYNTRRVARPAGLVAAAAALVAALALTPAGSLASSVVSIFEPQQITAIPVTRGDLQTLRGLPDLSSYGTMSYLQNPTTQQFTSATAAGQAAGFALRVPAHLPADIPASVTYNVMSQGIASFTFSAAKARAAAAATGKAIPPLPADLDGSTLRLSVGPVVVATYGGDVFGKSLVSDSAARRQAGSGGKSAIAQLRKDANPRRAVTGTRAGGGEIPSLVIVQAPRPRLSTTHNVTVTELENYLASQPGISPQLAAEIRGIGDPSTTLPVPIPIDRFDAHHVTLRDGADSLVVGDNTGVGSGIIWQDKGSVYAVAGALTQDQALSIANAL